MISVSKTSSSLKDPKIWSLKLHKSFKFEVSELHHNILWALILCISVICPKEIVKKCAHIMLLKLTRIQIKWLTFLTFTPSLLWEKVLINKLKISKINRQVERNLSKYFYFTHPGLSMSSKLSYFHPFLKKMIFLLKVDIFHLWRLKKWLDIAYSLKAMWSNT